MTNLGADGVLQIGENERVWRRPDHRLLQQRFWIDGRKQQQQLEHKTILTVYCDEKIHYNIIIIIIK